VTGTGRASSAGREDARSSRRRYESPQAIATLLRGERYIPDEGLATALYLTLEISVPLLLEGEPGVGKTEVAKALAAATGRHLLRLQCYEGIDSAAALYEWDHARQLMHLRAVADSGRQAEDELYSARYLLERPLLSALRAGDDAVLLVDELDRSDDAFEAFLLELLSDFQITIPELGTVAALSPPVVVLTSNRTRELHDALLRRCLYHWIEYPTVAREVEILEARAPGLPGSLLREVSAVVGHLRTLDLYKSPGISETITWARALAALGLTRLDAGPAAATLGAVLKNQEDIEKVSDLLPALLRKRGD
jgi:MoxR-like ATPase